MRLITNILCLALSLFSNAQEQVVQSAFDKGNEAYLSGNYEIAIAQYEQVLKNDVHSIELYFNLGNAHYKLNQVGPAIYNYEKALMLDPDNADVLVNLNYAQQMRIDAIESIPKDQLSSRFNQLSTVLTIDEWAYTSLILLLVAVLLFVLYYYSYTGVKKRAFFVFMLIVFVASIITITLAYAQKQRTLKQRYAIVFAQETAATEEPKVKSKVSFTVHEGTKVSIIETYNDWAHIVLENGNKAWIKLDAIKRL